MPVSIPDSVRRLLERHIGSVGELEILLLTRRTKGRAWSADQASRELLTSPESARLRLDQLARKGFLKREPDGYTYAAGGELDATVADLERAYGRYRTRIVGMIFQ